MSSKPAAPTPLPVAPTEAEWQAMSPDERDRLLVKILDVVSNPRAKQAEAKAEQAAAKAEQALMGLRAGILAALETRALPAGDDVRARIQACEEPAMLQRWLIRALSATSAEEAVADEPSR